MRLAIHMQALLVVAILAGSSRGADDLTVARTWTNHAGEVIEGLLLDVNADYADILCEGKVYVIPTYTFKPDDQTLLRAEHQRRHPSNVTGAIVTPQVQPQPDPYAARQAAEERARLDNIARQRREWASPPPQQFSGPTPYQAGRIVGFVLMILTVLGTIKKVFFE